MTSLFRGDCVLTKRLILHLRHSRCHYCSSSSSLSEGIKDTSRYTAACSDVNVAATATSIDEAREAFTNDSAFMIAYERAIETENRIETPLICDPFARLLTGGGGAENNNNDDNDDNDNSKGKELSDLFGMNASKQFNLWPDFHKQWTAVRTKFIDDHICKIINEHKSNQRRRNKSNSNSNSNNTDDDDHKDKDNYNNDRIQFVNLGCGLDTRVLRLECMGEISTAYEVDMDIINTPKETLFNAILNSNSNESEIGTGTTTENTYRFKCPRKVINANLTNDGKDGMIHNLLSNGFDTQTPTIFLAEGLIMYLGNKSEQFLQDLNTLSASGDSNYWFILNFMDSPDIHHYDQARWTSMSKDRIRELLQEEGKWKDLKFNMFGDDILNYGRYDNQNYNPTKAFSFVVCRK